jgi:L-malate glycosyltransferase
MNILFVSEATGWSGGSNQMLLTANEFKRKGHNVVFALPEKGYVASRAKEDGFKTHNLEIKQDYDVLSAIRLKKIIKAENPDVIHAHHPQAHAIALIAKYLGAKPPLIVTRRVIFRIRTNPFSAIKYKSKKIAKFIAVCHATKHELIKGGIKPENIEVIPSSVQMEKYENAIKNKKKFAPPFRIGYVAHYAWFKGQDSLLEAAQDILKEFPDTKFVFGGRDTNQLKPIAKKLGIEKNVEILGEIKNVPEVLSALDVFAMPSLKEGIATALIEAQSAKVASVASNVGGIPDVTISNETGLLVPPKDPKALASAILKLLKDPKLAKTMSEKAFERVKNTFTLEVIGEKLLKTYQNAIEENKK